ncbi:DUF4433 domain-containing protein [Sphingomonas sinipercae]|uniref:DUF4433 domain-containing protein n=1 Tax=Sphingomonas sinipercae TaxID=2714944 RepID=A0A6G7ZL20_9SPHN|nr:DUF4433 domain-containing protein [Sphingomonas sinipercae]QIL01618.1 DUF4433 domain-containing protein [Sphingomonas sinipercae]
MPPCPANAKIYHIVHIDRLPSILAAGGLLSDARMRAAGACGTTIGMGDLKATRLRRQVDVRPRTFVGDYVPFYFCSRSIMLYVIHMANHPALAYRGGQQPIIHLEADLARVLDWVEEQEVPWAFSLGNATAVFTEFRAHRGSLDELRWDLIPRTMFTDPEVKEAKQSELLVHDFFPWELFDRVGTHSDPIAMQVAQALQGQPHRPLVQRMSGWYY